MIGYLAKFLNSFGSSKVSLIFLTALRLFSFSTPATLLSKSNALINLSIMLPSILYASTCCSSGNSFVTFFPSISSVNAVPNSINLFSECFGFLPDILIVVLNTPDALASFSGIYSVVTFTLSPAFLTSLAASSKLNILIPPRLFKWLNLYPGLVLLAITLASLIGSTLPSVLALSSILSSKSAYSFSILSSPISLACLLDAISSTILPTSMSFSA